MRKSVIIQRQMGCNLLRQKVSLLNVSSDRGGLVNEPVGLIHTSNIAISDRLAVSVLGLVVARCSRYGYGGR